MNGDLENVAAEYVLGTMDVSERAEFERRLAAEPEARHAVARWRERLLPLADALEPVVPSARVWNAIEAGISPQADRVVDIAIVTEALRRKVRVWRSATALITALAAALTLFVIDRTLLAPAPPEKSYVAVINQAGNAPALIIRVDTASRMMYVRPVAAEAPPGRSLELWYINAGQAPKSLGVVQNEPTRLSLPNDPSTNKVTLAVTSEPAGGSPTGAPTGPVIYSGELFAE